MTFIHYTITDEELGALYPKVRLSKRSTFVARNEGDILDCINHYRQRGLAFPPFRDESLIFDAPKLRILLEYTMVSHQSLEIPVLSEISFLVNPNAWGTFKEIASNFRNMNLERGALYKWVTGNTAHSQFYFLDRDIMEALAAYDLNPYEEQMQAWIREGQSGLAYLESEGIICRPPGKFRVYDGGKK